MSESNPFDDLAEDDPDAGDGADDDLDAPESGDSDADATPSPTREAGAGAQPGADPGGEAEAAPSLEGPTLTNSSPPFPYSDTEQQQMYVRDGLWDEFEDLGFDAELELRREFDVRNVEQRELDTAVVRLALERFSPREIAEMVVRTRGFDPAAVE